MELGKRTHLAATSESNTSYDVFGGDKMEMKKKLKMGCSATVNMLQPIVEGDRNASQWDATGNETTT